MLKKTQIHNKGAKSGVDTIYEADQQSPQGANSPLSPSRIDSVAKKTTKAKLKEKYNQ